ncbi:NADH-quinone oxidoreductase subunit E [Phycisphaerae bacterium RAS2]|nr:NADH-quinone oxidoreductase subunit E [Phycisphaerae bacterium RAS2]
MAWQVLDRITPVVDTEAPPVLNDAIRDKIRAFFPRYETKRAALLPALHVVQDALGHVSYAAMLEIAQVLEIPPSAVMDTLSFYTHFWDHHKGQKVVVLCRSLSCQLMGADAVLETLKDQLNIDEHGTTADGQFSLLTEECLAACDHAPCMLINEKLHKKVKPDDVAKVLKDPKNDQIVPERSDLFDKPSAAAPAPPELPTTSDVNEMKRA